MSMGCILNIVKYFQKTLRRNTKSTILESSNPIVQDYGDNGTEVISNEMDTIVPENAENEKLETETEEPVELSKKSPSNIKIFIDNGHGKDTAGKRSPYLVNKNLLPKIEFYEYKWNREIASEVVKQLCELGYDAELLVPEINDISLPERVKRVNTVCNKIGKNNVLLVSIHANAAGNGTDWYIAKGWSAFTTKGKTESDNFAEALYDEAEKNFTGRKIRTDKSDGDRDWEENFYIIRNTKCPAVLTENFFYDNVSDVKYILSDEGRNNVIKTHVNGIINYIKSKK